MRNLCAAFFILLLSCNVCCDGNITTTSGSLNILPQNKYVGLSGELWMDDKLTIDANESSATINLDVNSDLPVTDAGFMFRVDGNSRYFFYLDNSKHDAFRIADYTSGKEIFISYPAAHMKVSPGTYLSIDPGSNVVIPGRDREIDFGASHRWWSDCYCSNLHYESLIQHSQGYTGLPLQAFNSVSQIQTLPDGEINHSTVDKSLWGSDNNSIETNKLTYANSKAITYLNSDYLSRIAYLENRIKKLEAQINTC